MRMAMNGINAIAILPLIFTIAIACNSRKSDNEIKHITYEDPSGFYSHLGDLNRLCQPLRRETLRYKSPVSNQKSACTNLPPGLAAMQHGYSQEFLSSPQDKQSLREIVFYFTCSGNGSRHFWQGYGLPNEVKYLTPVPRTIYDRRIVTKKKLLDTISSDVSLSDASNGYVYFLPLVRLNFTDGITSAAYLKVQIEGYEVSTHSLTPTKEMFSQYKRLPDNYLEDPLAYYHFINSYGTGIITSTTFGGRFQVLVTSDRLKHDILNTDLTDKASLEGVLNQVINTDSEASRVTMLVEGGGFPASTSRKDIAQWQKMVMDAPVSLFPNVLPIYKFLELDSSVRTGRYEGLRQTVQYEQEIQNIRKVLYALDMVKTSRLSIFLKNILYEEVQRVCPSSQVSNIIKKGILDYNNLNLSKFSLRCNHKREYSEYHKEDVKRAHLFKLLPGICFTVTEKLETCEFSRMTLPPEVRCINFYKENHCHGAVGKLVTNFDDLNQAFNAGLKSFAFCE